MENRQVVVIYGDSLVIDMTETCLSGNPRFFAIRFYSYDSEVEKRMYQINPALIVFDLQTHCLQQILLYLKANPSVPLLGLDLADSDTAILLSAQSCTVSTNAELSALIQTIITAHPPETSENIERKKRLPAGR